MDSQTFSQRALEETAANNERLRAFLIKACANIDLHIDRSAGDKETLKTIFVLTFAERVSAFEEAPDNLATYGEKIAHEVEKFVAAFSNYGRLAAYQYSPDLAQAGLINLLTLQDENQASLTRMEKEYSYVVDDIMNDNVRQEKINDTVRALEINRGLVEDQIKMSVIYPAPEGAGEAYVPQQRLEQLTQAAVEKTRLKLERVESLYRPLFKPLQKNPFNQKPKGYE